MHFASACIFLFALLGCSLGQTVTVSEYICQRLVQIGSDAVFGITGDYSYTFLHAVEANPSMKRIGNNNELEASYAAWAYAHVSPVRAPGVVSVTYGPGSYPVISALAGAMRENMPMIVISGAAPTQNWQYYDSFGALTHHMVPGLPSTQKNVFEPVTVAQEIISNSASAGAQIDNIIITALVQNKPVYLEVWFELFTAQIPAPVGVISRDSLPIPVATIQTNVNNAVAFTLAQLKASHFPIIFVSLEVKIYDVQDLFQQLISIANIPYYTNYAAKGILTEPNTWYTGILGTGNTKEYMADFLLEIGTTYDDNSHTTASFAPNARGYVRARQGKVDTSARNIYPSVPLKPFLQGLIAAIQSSGYYNNNYTFCQSYAFPVPTADVPSSNLTYKGLINHMQNANLFNQDTVLLVDTTIMMYYVQKAVPIRQDGYVGDTFWLAIGWTGGAALGVKEALPDKRMIVIVGDGGFQNCPTGLGTSVAYGHDSIIFILHNNVYAIEQHVEDATPYDNRSIPFFPENIIQDWNYAQFAASVGAHGYRTYTHADLSYAIAGALAYDGTTVIEVMLDFYDLPPQGTIPVPPACPTTTPPTTAGTTSSSSSATTATTASTSASTSTSTTAAPATTSTSASSSTSSKGSTTSTSAHATSSTAHATSSTSHTSQHSSTTHSGSSSHHSSTWRK